MSAQTVPSPPRSARPDLTRPLMEQVGALGDDYDAWVHDGIGPRQAAALNARLVEAGDEVAARWPGSLRMFRTRWLESMSHIPWWLIPLVWVPVVAGLLVGACALEGVPVVGALGWALLGLFLWTLTEYCLHRFAFHYRPRSAFGRKFHFLAHGIHHLDPWDPTRLVFPPLGALVIASGLFGLHLLFLPLGPAMACMGGLLAGYVTYDMTHYYTHHARPRSRWGKLLKAWHLAHHHKYWTRMYGVTSPLWDVVFRTGRPKS